MAKINFTNLNFTPSPGAGAHRLRLFPSDATPTPNEVYAAPFAEVGVDGVVDQVELEGIGGAGIEGTFDLYLTAVDAVGNESDFAVKEDYPLDLVAPAAPVWL
jgi:hypothetical protein